MLRSRNTMSMACVRHSASASSPPEASSRSCCKLAGRTRLHIARAVLESSTMSTRIGITLVGIERLVVGSRLEMKAHRNCGDLLASSLDQLGCLARRIQTQHRLVHHLVLID